MFSSLYYDKNQVFEFSRDEKKRLELLKGFIKLTNKFKDNEDDFNTLNNLFLAIQALEKELVKKIENEKLEKIKKEQESKLANETATPSEGIESYLAEHPELIKEKETLEKNDLAAWELYIESVRLAELLVSQNEGKKLEDEVKKEVELLKKSVEFTTKVAHRDKLTEIELINVSKLSSEINTHLQNQLANPSTKVKDIERKQRWAKFVIALAAILFIASIVALASAITFGGAGVAAIAGLGVVVFFGCGFGAAVGAGYIHSDLSEEKQFLVKPKHELHRFHQSAEKHAKNLGYQIPTESPTTKKK